MTNREKIIVGLMLIVVVYGVYTLFLSSPSETKISGQQNLETLNTFVAKIADKAKSGLSKKQSYVLQKAKTKWKQDPLIQMREAPKVEEEEIIMPATKSKIVYTGFLQMGNKRLAIISGMEYEAGDKLEPGGFIVRNINPNHVVLGTSNTGKQTFIIPMEEME
ncbi:MAG: hypothetical protein PVG08_09400 [Desulfobacterales bacterium]|jgi:hypothetical protein